jgi:hypothetical protein
MEQWHCKSRHSGYLGRYSETEVAEWCIALFIYPKKSAKDQFLNEFLRLQKSSRLANVRAQAQTHA